MELNTFFKEYPTVALAFSGGVDSAYLLYAALKHGADVKPYYVKTAFQPQFELEDALRLGRELDVEITIIQADILSVETVRTNPADRCYYCKHTLFNLIKKRAKADGCRILIDGTNASDDADDRPGMRALDELAVRSPLREANITKGKVRQLSKEAGLFTWDKPAYACLATRIKTGMSIEAAALIKIEKAEDALMKLGFADFRVRLFGDEARLQIKEAQMAKAFEHKAQILAALNSHFPVVTLDLKAR